MKKSRVILLPCNSYREEVVYNNLKTGLDLLEGIQSFVKKEESVLLKPNLLKKAEVEKAVITHPVVVGMFARILREEGYGDIILADSCGNGTASRVIHGTGMDRYLEELKIPVVDYTKAVKVSYPEGKQAKEFVLPQELLDRDCVISLSKMKTHALERITGAVKNSYGFVYGFHKAKRAYALSQCRQFCQNAGGSEPVCETKALYYGWDCRYGREWTWFRRSCSHECDPYVSRSSSTGQCFLPVDTPETSAGTHQLSWGKNGPWDLGGRADRAFYSGRTDFYGRSSGAVWQSLFRCGPQDCPSWNLAENGKSPEYFSEETVYPGR